MQINKTNNQHISLPESFYDRYLVLGFAAEGKDVFGLAIGDLIDTEPFVGSTDKAGQVLLDILDIYNENGGQSKQQRI